MHRFCPHPYPSASFILSLTVEPREFIAPPLLSIHHLDTPWRCFIPAAGFTPRQASEPHTAAIVRIPVHRAAEVQNAAGALLSPFQVDAEPEPTTNAKLNVSETIVEWRIVMITAFGCSASSEGGAVCPGK